MSTPACYVIAGVDWNGAVGAVAWAFWLMLAMVFLATVRWYEFEDRVRRFLRRRRIRAIRQSRGGWL